MIGERYWSIGIVLTYDRKNWGGEVEFYDNGFVDDDADAGRISTEGILRSRYYIADGDHASALTVVIDVLKADAERLGIQWRDSPHLHVKGDGEWEDFPPPEDWRLLLLQQSERIGWPPLYTDLLTFQLTKPDPSDPA